MPYTVRWRCGVGLTAPLLLALKFTMFSLNSGIPILLGCIGLWLTFLPFDLLWLVISTMCIDCFNSVTQRQINCFISTLCSSFLFHLVHLSALKHHCISLGFWLDECLASSFVCVSRRSLSFITSGLNYIIHVYTFKFKILNKLQACFVHALKSDCKTFHFVYPSVLVSWLLNGVLQMTAKLTEPPSPVFFKLAFGLCVCNFDWRNYGQYHMFALLEALCRYGCFCCIFSPNLWWRQSTPSFLVNSKMSSSMK